MMFVLWRGAVWAERRAMNLVHCAFHVSDDWKLFCCWSTCEVLVVIILIVNEAKVTWRSSEVSHKLSKEAVRGLMFSLLPLPISLVTLIPKHLISISLKGVFQHFGVLYRSIWWIGTESPIDSVWHCWTGCRLFDGCRAKGFPKDGLFLASERVCTPANQHDFIPSWHLDKSHFCGRLLLVVLWVQADAVSFADITESSFFP